MDSAASLTVSQPSQNFEPEVEELWRPQLFEQDLFHGMALGLPNLQARTQVASVQANLLSVSQIYREDGGRGLDATFGYLPSHPSFNQTIDRAVFDVIRAHDHETKSRYVPAAQGLPEDRPIRQCGHADLPDSRPASSRYLIDCNVVLANGPYFAERLLISEVYSENAVKTPEQHSRTFYTEVGVKNPRVVEFDGLTKNYAEEFLPHVVDLLFPNVFEDSATGVTAEDSETLSDRQQLILQEVDNAIHAAVFTEAGDFLLLLPEALTGKEAVEVNPFGTESLEPEKLRTFLIHREEIEPYLNDFGQEILDAVIQQLPFEEQDRALPGKAWVNCNLVPCLAVTFDDGPKPGHTDKVLSALHDHDAAATFFVLGLQVKKHPELLQEVHAAGHEIGGHSWNHPRLPDLKKKELRKQFTKTNSAIRAIINETPKYYRPPYGMWNNKVRKASNQAGILWNVDSDDWRNAPDEKYLARALKVDQGDIVLFHDVQPQTVNNIDTILAEYTRRGYTMVTISQLFVDTPLRPGVIVYSR